jgi:hypothetical protein
MEYHKCRSIRNRNSVAAVASKTQKGVTPDHPQKSVNTRDPTPFFRFTMKDMEAASGSFIEKPMQDLPQNAQDAQGPEARP